ncbi:MAG: electron transport complex subunit E [Lachnospiraceae bacterium]|nr:electron transport complex subunit E [Lachnospiraceae bacterium]
MREDSVSERLYNGIIKENPVFIQLLGICPTLAVTTSAFNGLGMGLSATVVLALSNLLISALRKVIPDRVRMPAFIVVVASFVTIVQFLVQGYLPELYKSLGIFIPLIVVNCIILGRAESYASKHPIIPSFFDGIGMGLGFTVSLIFIGGVREILGSGAFFGYQILPLADAAAGKAGFTPISIFVLAPGAFFVLALLVVIMNIVRAKQEAKGRPLPAKNGCLSGECSGCSLAATCQGKSKAETVSKEGGNE